MTRHHPEEQPDRHTAKAKDRPQTARRRKHAWLVALAGILLAIIAWFLWIGVIGQDRRSADERLAEIEAARAIPDSENAAIVYNQLLRDPNVTEPLYDLPESTADELLGRALREPWFSKDIPVLAGWIRKYQSITQRLLEASQFERCWFPIRIDDRGWMETKDRMLATQMWGCLVGCEANNDIAEERIDAALMKWQCLIQMSNHLRQQPAGDDQEAGIIVAAYALWSMRGFVVQGAATETHLQKIEKMPLSIADDATIRLQETREIERLTDQKRMESYGPIDRLRSRFFTYRFNLAHGTLNDPNRDAWTLFLYRQHTATARGVRILVALKRYKNATGRWPESLDEIRALLPEEALIDPFNKDPFVYTLSANGFRLYSKGKNNVDEDDRWEPDGSADDWPIWPPHDWSLDSKQRDANGV